MIEQREKFPSWRNEEDYVITDGQTALYHKSGGKRGKYKPTPKELLEWSNSR